MAQRRAPLAVLPAATLILAGVAPQSANAGRVEVAEVSASSSFPPEEGASYDPPRLADGKISTAWVEGDEGSGLGSHFELKLPTETAVSELRVWGGMWFSAEFWERANRPQTLEIALSDGSKHICELANEMKAQSCSLGGAKTTSIKVKLKRAYDGSTWLDTAISEVQVVDTSENGVAPVVTTDQSSMLDADADGSYGADNVTDGIIDTMWCEGNKEGDGTGEWFSLYFDRPRPVSKLTLVNGIGGSVKYWMLGNRATKATLSFEDGTTEAVEVKNSARPQTIEFGSRTTRFVKIAFDEVYKGKEYNDLCISEAYYAQ